MNENNEILLEIKILEKKEDVEDRINDLRKGLTLLKTEQAALKTELKAGVITQAEYNKSLASIKTLLKSTEEQLTRNVQVVDTYTKTEQKAQESVNKMRSSVALLNPLFAELATSQGNVGDKSENLQKRIVALAGTFAKERAEAGGLASSMAYLEDQIADVDKAISQLTLAELKDAEVGGKLLKVKKELSTAQERNQKVIDNSSKGLKEYIRDINVLGINVGNTVDSFKSGAQGAGTFAKAIFTGRGALVALAAVPIVAILSGLYIILTKSQKGMDFLAQATEAVSAVFSALSNKVIAIGETLGNAFDNPKQAVIEFGQFLETNLINRFKALGVIIDGIRSGDFTKITDGVLQFGTGIENAYTRIKKVAGTGVDIAKASQAIEAAEISLNVQRGKSLVLIEKNKQLSEDTTKSAATRIAAAKKAFAEEEKLQKAEQAVQLQRLNLAKQEAKVGQNGREQQRKIAEEQEKYNQIEADAIGRRTEIQNNINSITKEAADKAKEDAKKAAQEKVDEAEAALIVAKRNGEDTIEIEQEVFTRTLELIQKKKAAELVGVKAGSQERKLIIEKANQEELDATLAHAQKVADIVYKAKKTQIDTSLALTRRGSQEELDLRIKDINNERNKLLAEAKRTIKDQDVLRDEEARINLTAARATSDARLEFAKAEITKRAELEGLFLQTKLDQDHQSLENERDIAAERIDLEEKTQIELLDLDKEYGQLADDEYLRRLNAIQQKALAAHKDANKQIADADRDNQIAIIDAELELTRDGSKKQLDEQLKKLKLQREKAIENAKGEKAAIDAINKEYDAQEEKATKDHYKKLKDQIFDIANQATSTLSTIVDAQVASQTSQLDQQYQAILSSTSLSADARIKIEAEYQKKKDAIEKKANEKRKKIATAQNLINGALAVTKAFVELGPIGGAIATALIAAQVIAAQVIIDNQKFGQGGIIDKKGAKGGLVNGPSHAQGGVKFQLGRRTIELEGGEAVINKKSTAKYFSQLSAINSDGGNGVAFAGVGVRPKTPPMFDVRHAVPKFQYGGMNSVLDSYAIAQAIQQGMAGVNIRVGVDEITKKQKSVIQAQANGDI